MTNNRSLGSRLTHYRLNSFIVVTLIGNILMIPYFKIKILALQEEMFPLGSNGLRIVNWESVKGIDYQTTVG